MKLKNFFLTGIFLFTFVFPFVSASGFVSVQGTEFYMDGKPFYFAGTNAYYLWYGSFDCSQAQIGQGCVTELMDDAVSLNVKVIRTWGSSEGYNKYGYNFQPSAGGYDEKTFQHFDRVIKEARDRDLKLIIVLVNNWNSFGGMDRYNSWCGTYSHDDFYTNNCVKNLYKNYINYMLNRRNTYTGVLYKDDETIMAWELANEPRCRSDKTGDTLNNWIGEMSNYIESIDNKHLITTGIDGGYKNKTNYSQYAWWYKGNEGQDYLRNHEWSNIDFATFHYYPDMDYSINAETWIREHIEDAHNIIGKPVVFEEFNTQNNKAENFIKWYDIVEEKGGNGDMFWMLSDYDNADNRGYDIHCPEDSQLCEIVHYHGNYMWDISNGVVIGDYFKYSDSSKTTYTEQNGWFNYEDMKKVADVDGDGMDDIIYFDFYGYVHVWKSDGNKFVYSGSTKTTYTEQNGWFNDANMKLVGDVDGDLKDDLLFFDYYGYIHVWKSDGTKFVYADSTKTKYSHANWFKEPDKRKIADVNGDGMDDLLYIRPNGDIYSLISDGNKFVQGTDTNTGYSWQNGWWSKEDMVLVADVDGDLKDDLLFFDYFGNIIIWKSDGAKFVYSNSVNTPYTLQDGWFSYEDMKKVADVDGDGMDDLIWFDYYGNILYWNSNGNGFDYVGKARTRYSLNNGWYNYEDMKKVADVDGDGKDDIMWFDFFGSILNWEGNG